MEKTAITLQDSSSQVSSSSLTVDQTEQILERAVIRLNANILGIVLGIITGLGIFIATNFLILKGGEVVGPHLALLGAFFPYYRGNVPRQHSRFRLWIFMWLTSPDSSSPQSIIWL